MPLLKNGAIIKDDDANLISWREWQEQKTPAHNQKLGIIFPNDQDPHLLEKDLEQVALIALEFPTFRDGRAYSQARILREELGFAGELRATGDVLIDQAFFMLRCGFDALDLPQNADQKAWLKAFQDFSLWYQPTGADKQQTIWKLRHQKEKC